MDMGEMFKQKSAMQEQIMRSNMANSTMETDISNPMVFDTNSMKN